MRKIANYRYVPAVAVAIAVTVIVNFLLPPIIGIAVVSVSAMATVIVCIVKRKVMWAAVVPLIFSVIVCANVHIRIGTYEEMYDGGENVSIYARVCDLSETDENGLVTDNVVLDRAYCDGVELKGKIRAYNADISARIGDYVDLTADIDRIELDRDDIGGCGNYTEGIYYTAHISSVGAVSRGRENFTASVRIRAKSVLYRNTDEDTAGFLYAMIFGDSRSLSESIRSDFSATGLAHVFAVSGLHVGILASAAAAVMKKLRKERYAFFAVMPLLIVYGALCGYSPSVVRASLMTAFLTGSRLLGYNDDGLSSLSLACVCILCVDPLYLFDLGFIMSAFAVLGIVLFASPIAKKLDLLPDGLASLIGVSIAVNIALLPVCIYCFGGVSLIFLSANLLVVPLAGILFPIMIVCLFIGMIPYFGVAAGIAAFPFKAITSAVSLLASIGMPSVSFYMDRYIMAVYIVMMFACSRFVFIPRLPKRMIACAFMLICASAVIYNSHIPAISGTRIYVAPSGYAIVEGEDGCSVVISADCGEAILSEISREMRKKGIRGGTRLILTELTESAARAVNAYASVLGITEVNAVAADGGICDILTSQRDDVYGADNGDIIYDIEGVRLLFSLNGGEVGGYHDAAVTYGSAVHSDGCEVLGAHTGNNGFTFNINNGKIFLIRR